MATAAGSGGGGGVVTVMVPLLPIMPSASVARTVIAPAVTAVNKPVVVFTVAIVGLLLVQLYGAAPPATVNCNVPAVSTDAVGGETVIVLTVMTAELAVAPLASTAVTVTVPDVNADSTAVEALMFATAVLFVDQV